MSELTVTFQGFDRSRSHDPGNRALSFSIEPPLDVYDHEFINEVVESRPSESARGFTIGRPAGEVMLKFSDSDATYGTYITPIQYISGAKPAAELQGFLQSVFEDALNPLGKAAINFVFHFESE